MFSREIEIRTTDAHSAVDRATGNRINMPESVIIGDHVWVGVGAIINKGSVVPSDSIVGAMAFVNRRFEEQGIILGGVPATIVRRGITWNRGRKNKFTTEELDHWKPASDADC
jgi:acetyltransferase-like isoleucine patch superfamily enzyme